MDSILNHLQNTTEEELLDWCVNWTDAIVHDEFNKKEPRFSTKKLGDYRERAIDRLIAMRISWNSNGNIDYNVARRYLIVKCPYCETQMDFNGMSGRMYVCPNCKASATPSVEISFSPPKAGQP